METQSRKREQMSRNVCLKQHGEVRHASMEQDSKTHVCRSSNNKSMERSSQEEGLLFRVCEIVKHTEKVVDGDNSKSMLVRTKLPRILCLTACFGQQAHGDAITWKITNETEYTSTCSWTQEAAIIHVPIKR